MAKAFTAVALTKLKADPKKRLEIPDGMLAGLYLIIQPSGAKSWAVRYRHFGKPRKLTISPYLAGDDVQRAGAELRRIRAEAGDLLERVQRGEDPGAEKVAKKRQAREDGDSDPKRFENVVRRFIAIYAKPKNRSWRETARILGLSPDKAKTEASDDPLQFAVVKSSIVDRWGHRPLGSIQRSEIIGLFDEIAERGAPIAANRTLAALRKLYSWAIAKDLAEANPCANVAKAAEISRDRVLSDDEVSAFWKATGEVGWPFGELFRLLLLTAQRRDEVREMTWGEIKGDLWSISGERVKNGVAHDVPLAEPVRAILDKLPRASGSSLVFTTNGKTPISGLSKSKLAVDTRMLVHLRKAAEERGEDPAGIELQPWRLHDLRRTAASGMAALGIPLEVIEKVLNHVSGKFAGVAGVYQRHDFAVDKETALEAWGRFIELLTDDEARAAHASYMAAHDREERKRREREFRHAIQEGGTRWRSFLDAMKNGSAEDERVVPIRGSR
ncbi:tyrosine-type recombinase/integrase [Chelatococcus sp. GCM10030263]|uniref:tyrosine-type recombinase/integrase n=1 Tax=Chelatococcus sp. GCM10030263 TaxID=3273387 RepID=UPI00361BBBDA